ncbi:MAG: NCS2 family permease [Clostridiales bacterium]|nr:NCS2 family permease [Clostridiales bacterium]
MAKYFEFDKHKTNLSTEVNAGITTFMTMAYILIVNPIILSNTGMDFQAVFTATALSSLLATLVMGLYAKLPFALAPGMGLNAFFAFTVVLGMGKTWEFALTAVFLEGIIFILLTIFNVREAIINSIPMGIKKAISVGIGLFIAFIGLSNAGIIQAGGGTPLFLGDVTSGGALLALIGLLITSILLVKKVKGALLIGIIATTIVGFPMGITVLPTAIVQAPPSMAPIFFKFQWDQVFTLDMLVVLFTFLFVDMFDTVGTLIGVSTKAGMLDEEGKVPNAKKALMADALGTTFGAIFGTSTVTTYVESAAGVSEGGRTGFTAVTTAGMFALALFLSPIFIMIPGAATAPALILVGLFMLSPITEINFEDYSESIPAFVTLLFMPLTYSISDGIVFGIISYVLIKLLTGKSKDISPMTYVIAAIFVLKFLV